MTALTGKINTGKPHVAPENVWPAVNFIDVFM